jgi:ankyrin repeat protein
MTIQQKLSPDEQTNLDRSLISAARDGHTETVKTLLTAGANLHDSDDGALRVAAFNGHTETVRVLLAAGADAHALNDWALSAASGFGHTETVSALLGAGADVHASDDLAVRRAARDGHAETVRALLEAGADVRIWDDEALRMSAYLGHTETVRILAEYVFAPDPWRGKSRAEIEAEATALYNKINKSLFPIKPERLHEAASILADRAIDCWHQVRPAPPKLTISPLPAQPKAL